MTKPRLIKKFLSDRSRLKQLLEPIAELGQQAAAVQSCLGPMLSQHCRLANINHGKLIMHAETPVWATRLRYQAPALLDCLRNLRGGPDYLDIVIRVRPSSQTAPAPHRTAQRSKTGSAVLESAAQTTEHQELRRALQRLAANVGRPAGS